MDFKIDRLSSQKTISGYGVVDSISHGLYGWDAGCEYLKQMKSSKAATFFMTSYSDLKETLQNFGMNEDRIPVSRSILTVMKNQNEAMITCGLTSQDLEQSIGFLFRSLALKEFSLNVVADDEDGYGFVSNAEDATDGIFFTSPIFTMRRSES